MTDWNSMDSLRPEPGVVVVVQQESLFRWEPYKEGSSQHRAGTMGRWQRKCGDNWQNADLHGTGWRSTAAAVPRVEPTTCGYCSYEEADGSLIEQCPKCAAIDARRRTESAPESQQA